MTRSYVAVEADSIDGRHPKIVMFEAGNGDLYLSVCYEDELMGRPVIRLERSGGCATRNPELLKAAGALFEALAEDSHP